MRRFGSFLMYLGAGLGLLTGVGILVHLKITGISWFMTVALAKLLLASSIGLMAGGAVMHRVASRLDEADRRLGAGRD